jgi:LPS-assembly protein
MAGMTRFFSTFMLILAVLPAAVPAQTQDSGGQSGMCPIPLDIPKRPTVDQALEPGDIYMKADKANFVQDGKSHLEGDVEITQDQKQCRADAIDYYQPSNSADLMGNVRYWDDQVYLNSPTAHVNFDNDTAEFPSADYRIITNRGRGFAKHLTVVSGKTTTGKGVDYTTCDPETGPGDAWNMDKNFWKISASKIVLNQETERGHADNVILRIKDIPVFYTPYISFPLTKKRKSGFLVPSFGTSSNGGFQFSTPYYWNIEPQMDATIAPKYITNRGVMGEGEYRYLLQRGNGQINLDYLPSDSAYDNHHRSYIHYEHDQSFLSSGHLSLLFNQVSDSHYFEDFGNNLSTASTRYLPREAEIRYSGKGWRVTSRLQNYQIVDQSLVTTSRPYSRLPQIIFNAYPFTGNNLLNLRVDTEFDYFDRNTQVGFVDDVNGFRLDVYPKLSYPWSTQAAFLTPQVGVRYTQYYLGNSTLFSDSPSRLLPMASLKGGIFLERNTTLFGTNYRQTLEPNFYYLLVPGKNQGNLPIFDTGEYSLTYNSLFRDNRFSGPDRFGDANQITLALTSRLIESKTGREQAYLRLGQILYLAKQDVQRQIINSQGNLVETGLPLRDSYSPLVLEVGTNFFKDWHFDGQLQWDPNDNVTRKLVFNAQYHPGEGRVLNLGYRVRRRPAGQVIRTTANIDQSDISFRWPLNERWSVVGRWNYAVPEGKSLELFGGIEYESCCWGVRAVVRRYLTNLDGDFQTGFFIQLQLKGLAGLGQSTVNFLNQSIPGYHSEF